MQGIRVSDVMAEDVRHVAPNLPVLELDRQLAAYRISGAPVTDRDGRVVGIVSRSDIERALAQERTKAAAVASYYVEVDPTDELAALDSQDPTHAAFESIREMTVDDIMSRDVLSVAPGAALVEAARVMKDRRIHRLLVLEDGSLVGIVSALDIVGAVADSANG